MFIHRGVHLHLFAWPAGTFKVPVIGPKVTKAYLQRTPLRVEQAAGGVAVSLPGQALEAVVSVVCLEVEP